MESAVQRGALPRGAPRARSFRVQGSEAAILKFMKNADSILKKALALPTEERERLALRLMESLGGDRPPGVVSEDELADTIDERLADLDAGRAKLIDTKKALAKGRAKLRRRRRVD